MGRVLRFLRSKLHIGPGSNTGDMTAVRFGFLDRDPFQGLRHVFRLDRTAGG